MSIDVSLEAWLTDRRNQTCCDEPLALVRIVTTMTAQPTLHVGMVETGVRVAETSCEQCGESWQHSVPDDTFLEVDKNGRWVQLDDEEAEASWAFKQVLASGKKLKWENMSEMAVPVVQRLIEKGILVNIDDRPDLRMDPKNRPNRRMN